MSARPAAIADPSRAQVAPGQAIDWVRVTSLVQASRALDDIEETRLLPERKVLYQFSARGHDLAQILLGLQLTDAHDGVSVYYRSRSEEHTSELQSPCNLVCRLLLEKKKRIQRDLRHHYSLAAITPGIAINCTPDLAYATTKPGLESAVTRVACPSLTALRQSMLVHH